MRSLKTGLVTFAVTSFVGMAAIIGCSADGAGDVIEDENATEPDEGNGTYLPPSSSGSSSSSSSSGGSGTKDGGTKKDSGTKDAGPPPPEPGDACTKIDQIFKKACGACGTQEAVCLASGDAGAGTVSDYGPCTNEIAGGCIPGTEEDVACGNCGTAKKTCNKYCAWSTSACTGQPANSCKPGSVEYTAAGCGPSTYRKRDCQDSCQWTNYSTSCAAPVNDIVLNINGTAGQTASTTVQFSTAKMGPRLGYGTCPQTSNLSSGDYPYAYVEVKNTTAKAAAVTIYLTTATGGAVIDTVMAAYDTPIMPMDDAGRKNCKWGLNDQSYATDEQALTGDSDFSILKAVPIPAGASILVYVSTYVQYSATNPANTTGPIKFAVKTDTLN